MHEGWGNLIVIYLFLGGLGAGALVISGLATYLDREGKLEPLARAGALLAPLPVMLGSGLLIFDLGRPFAFWNLFFTIQLDSPMSIGSWLLVLFTVLALFNAMLHLPQGRAPWRPQRIRAWRKVFSALGLPLGLGVGIYTGVLLGAVPARPFWNTPMVAQLFLFSALSTATALLMLALPWVTGGNGRAAEARRLLLSADIVLIMLELLIIVPYILHGKLSMLSARHSLDLILGGPYTGLFWIGVVACGLILPALIETAELAPTLLGNRVFRPHRAVEVAVSVLVLGGGFLLRYVFVHAGEISHLL